VMAEASPTAKDKKHVDAVFDGECLSHWPLGVVLPVPHPMRTRLARQDRLTREPVSTRESLAKGVKVTLSDLQGTPPTPHRHRTAGSTS